MRNSSGLTAAAFAVMAAGALVLLSGCISSERAWRNSPAGSGEIRVRFDNQTVNVWPLYYHNDDFTSVQVEITGGTVFSPRFLFSSGAVRSASSDRYGEPPPTKR